VAQRRRSPQARGRRPGLAGRFKGVLGGGGRCGDAVDGRIRLLRVLAVLAFFIVGGRAIALASSADTLAGIAQGQQRCTLTLPAHRGSIVDRDGHDLAVGEPRQTVYATPYMLDDPEAATAKLCKALQITKKAKVKALRAALSDGSSGFAFVARQVTSERADSALELDLPGVGSYAEEKRVYPLGGVGAQVVGFAGVDNSGIAGIEATYEAALAGRPGSALVVRDPAGRTLKTLEQVQPRPGKTVRLMLDADIQYAAEQVLERTVRDFGATAAVGIVLDARSGEILAMANVPRVGDHRFGVDARFERNRAVTDAYEPGSIFKAVTIAGALADGTVSPGTKFKLPPSIQVADRVVREAHERGTETFTVRDVLAQSSNVGAVKIGLEMGQEALLRWVDAFGFGETTGSDFPGEAAGIVPREWSGSTIGNLPMGQGIAVTPLQMASAFAVLANRGVWVQPQLTAQVGTRSMPAPERRRVVPAKVARQMLAMLTHAVEDGTGTEARIDGYVMAGKTGTAQKPLADGSGYSKSGYIASFVGIVPADDPQLVILVSVDEPRAAIWGGVVAAPAVRDIGAFALQHLEIEP
jgi:cell division protein FtsI (penicillin-binding protein 3)